MSRIVRIAGLLALMLAMSAGLFAGKASAAGEATLIIHARGCYTGDYDVYADCHDTAVAGAYFEVGGVGQVTDATGNVGWTLAPGSYTIITTDEVNSALLGAYCSYEEDLGMETYIPLPGNITFGAGDVVYCDVYLYLGDAPKKGDDGGKKHDDGGKKHDGGTEMPDTGIGAAVGMGSLIPLALSGAAAAGMGFGVRRRKA